MERNINELLPARWSLLSRLKDWDDGDSWRQFFDTYWRLIYNTGLKSGLTHTEAEEVVQEVVITVARKIGEFRTNRAAGSFKAWLLTLTHWRIKDQFRKRARQPLRHQTRTEEGSSTAMIERIPDPGLGELQASWDTEWRNQVAQTALERIKAVSKPEMLQVFDLLVNKQWSALKVANRLGMNLAQVYYAKYKVAAALKREIKRLENYGF